MIQELDLAPGERARFISDIHFGHAKALAREPEELGFLLEGCSHLVVCGDLSETRESPCREEGLEKRARFLRMCRDAGVQPVLLAGNHDPDEKAGLLKLQGGRICALHGHALFREVAPWGWEYLKNKQVSRELIAAFPEAEVDLLRRLELARTMSVLVPPVYTCSGTHQNKLVRFFSSFCLAAGTARADSSGMADDDAAHGEICRPFFSGSGSRHFWPSSPAGGEREKGAAAVRQPGRLFPPCQMLGGGRNAGKRSLHPQLYARRI